MCATTFYTFMRLGEISPCTQAHNVMQLIQITKLSRTDGFVASMKLTFHQFRHYYNKPPTFHKYFPPAGCLPSGNPNKILFFIAWLSVGAAISTPEMGPPLQ